MFDDAGQAIRVMLFSMLGLLALPVGTALLLNYAPPLGMLAWMVAVPMTIFLPLLRLLPWLGDRESLHHPGIFSSDVGLTAQIVVLLVLSGLLLLFDAWAPLLRDFSG